VFILRILIVHNRYQTPGGEDTVVRSEADLLAARGHTVDQWLIDNEGIKDTSTKIKTALNLSYNRQSRDALVRQIQEFQPNVVHFHNTFPRLSPSVYDACRHMNVPVVQTAHNFRFLCAGALLMRAGRPCELCVKRSPYFGALHRCYRNSSLGSFAAARMIARHRREGTWNHKVDALIVLTQFAKQRFIDGGFAPDRLHVKPNFVMDPGLSERKRSGFLYVGRLSEEKGLQTLIAAWRDIDEPLTILGEGPLLDWISRNAPRSVTVLGSQSKETVLGHMKNSLALIMPSVWYEGFPMVVAEALACGLPVIASRIGSLEEIVGGNQAGMLFSPGNENELKALVRKTLRNPELLAQSSRRARRAYERLYSPDQNYKQLMTIYTQLR